VAPTQHRLPSSSRHLNVSPRRAPRVTRRYAVFGYIIESAVALPELEPTALRDPAHWRIAVGHGSPEPSVVAPLGADLVFGDIHVRAYAVGTELRLAFDDTGIFDIHTARRRIVWYPGPSVTDVSVRADLLGRVMALAAHTDGHVALHASAVSIDGRAVAFLGPKHAGKSTLALALVRGGARLLADDTLVVRLGAGTACAAPGVQRMRLWNDSARALRVAVSELAGAKPIMDRLEPNEIETGLVPLDVCYLLEWSPELDGGAVRRERIPAVHAALAQVRFSKLGALAGGAIGVTLLDRVTNLTRSVPVLRASIGRDLESLGDVASQFMTWHSRANVSDAVTVR
jgi:hypothetical protein